jgi:hypothetical protein
MKRFLFIVMCLIIFFSCQKREIVGCQCQNNLTIFFNQPIQTPKEACLDSCGGDLRNFIWGTKY